MWHVGTAWWKVFERVVKNDQREPELPLERLKPVQSTVNEFGDVCSFRCIIDLVVTSTVKVDTIDAEDVG